MLSPCFRIALLTFLQALTELLMILISSSWSIRNSSFNFGLTRDRRVVQLPWPDQVTVIRNSEFEGIWSVGAMTWGTLTLTTLCAQCCRRIACLLQPKHFWNYNHVIDNSVTSPSSSTNIVTDIYLFTRGISSSDTYQRPSQYKLVSLFINWFRRICPCIFQVVVLYVVCQSLL